MANFDFQPILNWFTIVVVLFGSLFYISVMFVLVLRQNQLQSSFYRLCVFVGVADVSFALSKTALQTIPSLLYKYCPQTRHIIASVPFQTAANIQSWSMYFVMVFGVFVLSINRFSTIIGWNDGDTFWNKKPVFYGAIAFQWLWLFPFSLPQLHSCCYSSMTNNVTTIPQITNPKVFNVMWAADIGIEAGILTPALVAMYTLMFFKVLQQKSEIGPIQQNMYGGIQTQWPAEVRFALMGAILCCFYLILVINYVIVWVENGYDPYQRIAMNFVQLLFLFSNPFMLLLFGTKFREIYFQVFICNRFQVLLNQSNS